MPADNYGYYYSMNFTNLIKNKNFIIIQSKYNLGSFYSTFKFNYILQTY